ncbi:alkaline phosphatase family protein [Agromyces sp. Marseille-Q5079]|uniref:alkaline phosphatase family protein n=1 Tax=Agromyces sp. Marseille-Q5079 TaxID=3439059 RepID=UPI003D9C8AB5
MRRRHRAVAVSAGCLSVALLLPALPAVAHEDDEADAAPLAASSFTEDFDALTPALGPSVHETHIPSSTLGWTPTAPSGWTVTNDASMGAKGKSEWRGWTFATPAFWAAAQGGQGREDFSKGSGVIAVADNDEWDDGNTPGEQLYASTLTSPAIAVAGGSTVHVNFDSNYRQTGPQVAALDVSFDGGAPQRLFEYSTAVLGDQVYLQNRTLTQPVAVPQGAASMKLSWVIEKATNDWYWAVDDVSVDAAPRAGAESPLPDPGPQPSDVPDGISSRKVLFIDFDGVRYDKLREYATPNIDALAAKGQIGVGFMQDNALGPTVSGHGHANLLSGVWVDKHHSPDNNFTNPNIEAYPDLLTRLEEVNPGFSTFSTADWKPLNDHLILRPDVKMQQTGASAAATDEQSVADAVEVLGTRDPDAMVVYLHNGDATGHAYTAESPQYKATIEKLDRQVGQLVDAIEAREAASDEDWLILASTDHGFTGYGHGGDQHLTRMIWTLASGGDVPATGTATRQWRQVDIAPTALEHLGVEIDPAWGLEGVPIGTPSSDPFDTVAAQLQGVVDEPAKPADTIGWTKQAPTGWEIDERTPTVGVTEYRGWSFMDGEFWASSEEGQGRGSFVRARDVIAVADPDEWNDLGDPAAGGSRFDSTLYSPWQAVRPGGTVDVSFLQHYRQSTKDAQHAEVVAEFDDGTSQVLWSRDASQGLLFEIDQPVSLSTVAPAGDVGRVRIGWRLSDGGNNGYWAVDAPEIHADAAVAPSISASIAPGALLRGKADVTMTVTGEDLEAFHAQLYTAAGTQVPSVKGYAWAPETDALTLPAVDFSALADGAYTFVFSAKSRNGLRDELKVGVVVDNTRPELAVTVSDGRVALTATDASGLRRAAVNLYDAANAKLLKAIGSTPAATPIGATEWTGDWALPAGLAPGVYTARAAVTDLAGNTRTVTTSVTIP